MGDWLVHSMPKCVQYILRDLLVDGLKEMQLNSRVQ